MHVIYTIILLLLAMFCFRILRILISYSVNRGQGEVLVLIRSPVSFPVAILQSNGAVHHRIAWVR